jgi:hypothetical protein
MIPQYPTDLVGKAFGALVMVLHKMMTYKEPLAIFVSQSSKDKSGKG